MNQRLALLAAAVLLTTACAVSALGDDFSSYTNDEMFAMLESASGSSSVDCGPIIAELLTRQATGSLRSDVKMSCGDYYVQTTIVTPNKAGWALNGSGGQGYALPDSHWIGHALGGAATRLIWVGESGGTILRVRGLGAHVERITFQGCRFTGSTTELPTSRAGIGIEISGLAQPPTGKHSFEDISIIGCDTAIDCPEGTHADQLDWRHLVVQLCSTVYHVDNLQSVCHRIRGLTALQGCDTVFDFEDGGELECSSVSTTSCQLLHVGNPNWNTGHFFVENWSIDNVARDVQVLAVDGNGPCNVHISGWADHLVTFVSNVTGTGTVATIELDQR